MRDALGSVQSVLVLGGNSEIALAIVDRLVASRCTKVLLGVRSPGSASGTLDRLRSAGINADTLVFDALDSASHTKVIEAAAERIGDLDMVILAFGVLGDQAEFNADPIAAAQAAQANYVGAVSSGLAAAARLRMQGHGTILAITSVAGVRARADNFVYGSTKAGMDAFAQGLGDSLIGSGARCVVVRPGFVHTRMTEGMKPAPFATTPDKIADAVVNGLQKNKELIWAPPIMSLLFTILRHLPRPLWRKISAG
ncbi:MAG: decaprenylphospho-beta-D-erythro-pentofuranosid-2-ulose 2-reductase [Acidimicrobiales bacterium]